MRPYSIDLRERVVSSVASGRSCRATAAMFGVSVASAVKWSQRFRKTGSAAPKPMGTRHIPRLAAQRVWLLRRIADKGVTLRQLVAELADRGVRISYGAVWMFFHREGISFQTGGPARRRAGPSRRRPAARKVEGSPGEA
jgi:transposase